MKEKRKSAFAILVWIFFLLPSCTFLSLRITSCYTITEQLPLLERIISVRHNTIYIFFPNATGRIRPVAYFTGSAANLHVSPDGKYLLVPKLRETDLKELPEDAAFLFEQATGVTVTHYLESLALIEIETGAILNVEVPNMLRTYSLKGWFDSEWLLFEPVFGTIEQGFLGWSVIDISQPKGSIFLFNPFTEQSISIVPHLPVELTPDFLILPRWWLYPFAYHPDRQKVFFYTHTKEGTSKYVLWNIANQQVIWEKAINPAEVGVPARWSTDGKYIAYYHQGSQSLVLLDMQGTETRIPLPSEQYVPPNVFTWSPDGQRLAFWIGGLSGKDDIGRSFEFVVYDTRTNVMTNTCIVEEEAKEFFWSSDGRFILISEESHKYLLLDLQEKHAFRFAFEHGEIIGVK